MSQWTCISKLVWLDNNLPCLVICCAFTDSVIRQITATKANFLILERYKWYVSKIMQEKCTKFNVKMTRTMYSLLKCRPYSSLKSIVEMYAMVLSSLNIHTIFCGKSLVFQCYRHWDSDLSFSGLIYAAVQWRNVSLFLSCYQSDDTRSSQFWQSQMSQNIIPKNVFFLYGSVLN